MGKLSSFLRNSSYRRTTINPAHENKNSRLVEMTLGLVHAIYGLPKWRAEYRLRVCLHDLKYWNKLNLTQDEIKQFLKNFQSLFVYPLVLHAHIYYSSRFIASKKKFCSYHIVFLKKLTFGVSWQWQIVGWQCVSTNTGSPAQTHLTRNGVIWFWILRSL